MTARTSAPASADTGRAGEKFRTDIQALRAVAVLLVFGYHLFPSRLTGGFVGVDVFFVISGYLIVGNLLREAETSGSVRLWRFWSRRAKRLAPASMLVLVTSAVATVLWVPQNLWTGFFHEILASTFYVQNWLLASNSVDYLAADNVASPVQHFWTLSVEEQFYIATPLMLIVVLLGARRFKLEHRHVFLIVISAIVATSLAYSVWLTAESAPSAYFATTTRAWEFGAGALLVFVRRSPGVLAATISAVVGVLGLAGCSLILADGDPFPGWIAVLVVVPSVLLIWAGPGIAPVLGRVVAWKPVQLIGETSYSVYLWHWPLIILVPYLTEQPLRLTDKAAIVVATLLLGWASTRFVENPVRYSPRLLGGNRRPAVIMAWSVTGMALVSVLVAGGFALQAERRSDAAERAAAAVANHPECLGARYLDHRSACAGAIPADVLIPDPSLAANDDENSPDCWSRFDDPTFNICTFGPPDAEVRLAAIGDSHSNALISAYRSIAESEGWRIDVAGHNGCYWTTAVQPKPTEAIVAACEQWKESLVEYLADKPAYDAILVTNSRTRLRPEASDGRTVNAVIEQGLVEAWAEQIARGTRIIAIRDNPTMAADVVTCVTKWGAQANKHCSEPRQRALGREDPLVDAARNTNGVSLIDLSDTYCGPTRCNPIIGNVVVYRDYDHLTATFVNSLVPRFVEQLRRLGIGQE